jgi:hypothetical protein
VKSPLRAPTPGSAEGDVRERGLRHHLSVTRTDRVAHDEARSMFSAWRCRGPFARVAGPRPAGGSGACFAYQRERHLQAGVADLVDELHVVPVAQLVVRDRVDQHRHAAPAPTSAYAVVTM